MMTTETPLTRRFAAPSPRAAGRGATTFPSPRVRGEGGPFAREARAQGRLRADEGLHRWLVLIAAAMFSVSAFAQTVTVGSIGAQCGQSVSVPVSIDNVSGLLSLEFRVAIDPSLTLSNVTAGTLTSSFSVSSEVVAGQVRVAVGAGKPGSGGGTEGGVNVKLAAS